MKNWVFEKLLTARLSIIVIIHFTCLAIATSAFGDDSAQRYVLVHDLWEPVAITAPVSEVKLVYIDYADDPSAPKAKWSDWGRKFNLLHSSDPESNKPKLEFFVKGRGGLDSELKTTISDYVVFNVKNLLMQKSITISESDRYFGVAPVVAEASVKTSAYSRNYPVDVKLSILIIIGTKGAQPTFNKTFPCEASDAAVAFENAVGEQFEQCFKRIMNRALREKKVKEFLHLGG